MKTKVYRAFTFGSLAVVWATTVSTTAYAVNISGLYNTGVDNSGNALAANVNDPHYDLVFPVASTNTEVTVNNGYPIPPWFVNNAGSRWIGPAANGYGLAGNYAYETTFSLPANANLNTVNITGLWSTDDSSIGLFINGFPTANSTSGHASLWPFSVSGSGLFNVGPNTLRFELNNSILAGFSNPTGLRVDQIQGTYLLIPEPATAGLAALVVAMSGVAALRRRHSSPSPATCH